MPVVIEEMEVAPPAPEGDGQARQEQAPPGPEPEGMAHRVELALVERAARAERLRAY